MKRSSTVFLRLAIIGIGLIAAAFAIFVVPAFGRGFPEEFPSIAYLRYPLMIGLWAAAVPFFMMLYQGWKLLGAIDKNTAFSDTSVKALKVIKWCAVTIGGIYALMVPTFFFPVAQIDDAPGLIIVGAIIATTPFVFAVFVAVLKRLLESAIAFKSENDLTV